MPEPISAVTHPDASARLARNRRALSALPATAQASRTRDIQETFMRYLRENYLPQGGNVRINPSDDLFDSGVLDSAAVLSVIVFIEREFAITIPDEDLLPGNVASVDAAVAYITRRLEEGRSGALQGEEARGVHEEVPGLGPR